MSRGNRADSATGRPLLQTGPVPSTTTADLAIIGAGPAGSAAAIVASRAGLNVVMADKAPIGRDKSCGDGLTPRAVAALDDLKVDLGDSHRIDGLTMMANSTVRTMDWPHGNRFGSHGAVWPRRRLDAHLASMAADAGADVRWESEALPILEHGGVTGIDVGGERIMAPLTILAGGATGQAARMLGAVRDPDEPFGLAIRAYATTPRHAERYLEACLTLRDHRGVPVPGYGWMFPAGDGTVNIGVGALSTMKGFKKLNLNTLLDIYRGVVDEAWDLGPFEERPRAWRLPMSVQRRAGRGWLAVGDAAGLVNPMNGEGIDYALESAMLAAELAFDSPATAPARYDAEIGARFDSFLRTGRRFSFLIGHPLVLRSGLRLAVGTQAVSELTLAVMGNLIDSDTPGMPGRTLRLADRLLGWGDPLLRRTRARP